MSFLPQLIQSNLKDSAACSPSVCSAHPDVLAASCLLAKDYDRDLIIEATSNQVNQFGGYTGMLPADFIASVQKIAESVGYPTERIVFGGDHLGPQVWRKEPADIAMQNAKDMMAAYVKAGFTKIHLDCSEGCAGEPAQVSDAVSAERATALAVVCAEHAPDPAALSFVVGTEVPPPGGARPEDEHDGVQPTTAQAAITTLDVHKAAFEAASDAALWERVIALVVQPGVEFAPDDIDHLPMGSPDLLSEILPDYPGICFEAHSTDYQYPAVFSELGRRHFAILKVGPALTYAYREAIYALSNFDQWLNNSTPISELMEAKMQSNPKYWQGHYQAEDDLKLRDLLHFSYADRIRYYWTEPDVMAAVDALQDRLQAVKPDHFLLRAFVPAATLERAYVLEKQGIAWHKAVIYTYIQEALAPYWQ
uniref:Tagatose-6-phosphate kinase AgaZ (EC) n=1 Tax=uncultured Thiotrichaceae bacterium TaxID=298394 RepID=A0A6S6SNA8_9GAMM|nr:MAG: Tagatose-6-phosphate kinase AgaZ (EC [uncultured Thiotrichaceae bacterium]